MATTRSPALSKDLRKRGWICPTDTVYAFMRRWDSSTITLTECSFRKLTVAELRDYA
jgi:hypothetical protein